MVAIRHADTAVLILALLAASGRSRAQEPAPPAPQQPAGTPPETSMTPQGTPPAVDPRAHGGQAPQEPAIPIPTDVDAEQRGLPVRNLTFEEALRLGRMHNVELRTAELLPQQARQSLMVEEAGFQPEIYGNAGYSSNKSPQRNAFQPSVEQETIDATLGWRQRVITGGLFDLAYQPARYVTTSSSGAFPDKQYTSEWIVSYTQPLLRGAWTDYNLGRISQARYGAARSQHEFDRTVQLTLFEVVQAYWELAFARENYRVVVTALQVAREQLRITDERIRVRDLAPIDRVADEAEVARRQEEVILADNAVRGREDDLRRLLLETQQSDFWRANLRTATPIEIQPSEQVRDFRALVDTALGHRPDLKALQSSIAAAEVDLEMSRRDELPDLNLVGAYSSDGARDEFGDAFDDSVDQDFPDWSLRLEFSIPIGNQAARARRQRAELEVERRRREYYGARIDVGKEVRDAVRDLDTLAQSIRASAESVRLFQSNLETEQVRLRVGSSTIFEVQRRNQDLREARSRHLRNQLGYRVAEGRLLLAQGLLTVPRE
jgi:outer membrane protein TolC